MKYQSLCNETLFPAIVPPAKLFDKAHDLDDELLQLLRFPDQPMQKGQRLALSKYVMNCLYALVIVVANGSELRVKVGQPHKKIVRILVAYRNPQRSIEYPRTDKIGRRAALCLA